jgi:hypothetical protein
MPEPTALILLALVGIVAGGIAGVVGFGSAVLLLPVCNSIFGPLASVGILTVAALVGNLSRVGLWYRDIEWKIVWRYWLGGIPMAILGALLLVKLDSKLIPLGFGIFIMFLVPARRWVDKTNRRVRLNHFPVLGGVMGFLSAIVATTGPINAPFFLSYGLVQGSYLSTEALSTAGIHLTKTLAYGKLSALDSRSLIAGLALGGCLLLGASLSKPLVKNLKEEQFTLVVEWLLVLSGLLLIGQAMLSLAGQTSSH